jgi:hypothetical protein
MNYIKPEDIKSYVEQNPSGIAGMSEELAAMVNHFVELALVNADDHKREMNTDPINKPFELDPKFIAKCDQLGRNRRQFQ